MLRVEGMCRLFPLPEVVLFPRAVLSLHVFEPRYRQLMAHALADDRLVTIIQTWLGSPPWPCEMEPRLEQTGCVGRIVAHDRLADGRINILLLGMGRVRLEADAPAATLYRQAPGSVVPDQRDRPGLEDELDSIRDAFRTWMGGVDPEIDRWLDSEDDPGALTDLMASVMPVPAAEKQSLLDECRIGRRLDRLRQAMQSFRRDELGVSRFSPN